MGITRLSCFLMIFGSMCQNALAIEGDQSCWNRELVVNRDFAPTSNSFAASDFLASHSSTQGPFSTPAKYYLELQSGQLSLSFDFDTPRIGLPYNLFAVQIVSVGQWSGSKNIVQEIDFTHSCAEAGYGLFPRGKLRLPSVPYGREEPQKFILKIWGHL